jgi:Retron-type reverse transcriptase
VKPAAGGEELLQAKGDEVNRPQEELMEAVLAKENLRAAWLQVKANDGAAGIDGMDVGRTKEHLRMHWEQIEAKLWEGKYQPAGVRVVEIPKPQGGTRTLGIPTVTDRLIEQAFGQVLSAIWEPHFSEHSYGFRPGRSAHDAVRAAQGYVSEGKEWVVDVDLKNFFDQVDHDILMRMVAERVRDKRVLKLIGRYLRAPMVQGRSEQVRVKGTPQGGPLSPLLANVYLDAFDKELERRGLSFVRYADDIAIYVSSPRAAERILESVIEWLRTELKLEVNREKSGSGPTDQSSLLGFRIDRRSEVSVAPKAIAKLKSRVRECWRSCQSKTSNQLRDQWKQYIEGWWAYFRIATNVRTVKDLSPWIRRHIRKCFWLRWHSIAGRYNALRKLGVGGRGLLIAQSSSKAWRMAINGQVHTALSNRTLQRYGLVLPWEIAAPSSSR